MDFLSILSSVIISIGIASSDNPIQYKYFPSIAEKKLDQYKPLSLKAACTNDIIMGIVTLPRPFYGVLYARNFPEGVCKIEGNGTKELRLSIPTFMCGTQLINKTDGNIEFEVYLYLQYDKKLQQIYDELLHLRCTPIQTTTVKSQMIHRKDIKKLNKELETKPNQSSSAPNESYRTVETPSISENLTYDSLRVTSSARFDFLSENDFPLDEIDPKMTMLLFTGEMSDTEPVIKAVNVGDIITLKITFKHPNNVNSRVVDCFANDGEKDVHRLLNSNGCTVDEDIMPNMNETYDEKTFTKTAFTTFRAFKIPSLNYVYIKCKIRLCLKKCNFNCSNPMEKSLENRFKRGKIEFESATEKSLFISSDNKTNEIKTVNQNETFLLEIRNKVNVEDAIYPYFANSASSAASYSASDFMTSVTKKDECLTSTRVIVLISLLLSFLIISLVVTICMCVKSRELTRRLLERRVIPFVKVPQYSP